jgi:iron complex outermembrane receptor protein
MQRFLDQVGERSVPSFIKRAVALALSKRSTLLYAVVGTVALPVHAQDAPSASNSLLQEVVVTARRREENMQKVPVAVSAVSGDLIEQVHLPSTNQLAQFVPNVVFDNIEAGTPGGGAFSIRGVSYQDVEKTFDPTV